MTRIVYVNGRYVRYAEAGVHVEDRGFQFADAVYEVCEVRGGRLIDEQRHLTRLTRSLAELGIRQPLSGRGLPIVMRECVKRNRVRDGVVYLQVTRGAGRRDFLFPSSDVEPTLVCLARSTDGAKLAALAQAGIGVKTVPEVRWARCDIKTVMLLPACLAKEAARADGAREAWFVDAHGLITEGASSNAWIVTKDNSLVTRPTGAQILPGVTRATLIDLLARDGIALQERPFTRDEALAASEAFTTSASATVMPVVKIDGHPIGSGSPGPVTRRLRSTFHQVAKVSSQ
jgi:D-alanine transaminase